MLTVRVRKKGHKLASIRESVKKIVGEKVEIGFFAQQGRHTGRDGVRDYTYAGLAQALELGFFPIQGEFRTPMPFMKNIMERTVYGMKRSTKVRRAFRTWGRRLDKKASPLVWMDAVGEYAKQESKKVFNNPAYFPQTPNNRTPLVETGELRSKFTYRTSYDKRVRRT